MAKIGIKCKLYYNSGATYATPTWVEVTLISDASVNFSWDEAEASTRAARIKQFMNSIASLEITGSIRTEPADVAYQKLRDAAIKDLTLDFLVLNGARTENDTDGFRFDGKVGQWNEGQGLNTVAFKQFNIKPVPSANLPKYAKVTTGTLAFEDIGTGA